MKRKTLLKIRTRLTGSLKICKNYEILFKYIFKTRKILQEKVLEIEQKALNLLRSEESEKALELLLANEHVIERIFKNFHPQRLYICYLISYCFLKLRNFDSCEFYNQKAFKILKNNEW